MIILDGWLVLLELFLLHMLEHRKIKMTPKCKLSQTLRGAGRVCTLILPGLTIQEITIVKYYSQNEMKKEKTQRVQGPFLKN